MGARGGQNMLEPSGYAVAVCFGPNTKNFRDVVAMLLAADAAVVVKDADSVYEFVRKCLASKDFRNKLGSRAKSLVEAQRGAADATVSMLLDLLPNTRSVAFSPRRDEMETGLASSIHSSEQQKWRRRRA